MWSRPALPNICGAGGDSSGSRSANIAIACLSIAFVRSVYLTPSEPFSIFSKPTASAQSTRPPRDRLAGEEERRGAGRAVVVHVHDRDPGEAEPIEGALAVGRVAVAVAGVGLLDVVVGDPGVGERLLPGLLGPVGVVAVLGARLVELGHADADHIRCAFAHLR